MIQRAFAAIFMFFLSRCAADALLPPTAHTKYTRRQDHITVRHMPPLLLIRFFAARFFIDCYAVSYAAYFDISPCALRCRARCDADAAVTIWRAAMPCCCFCHDEPLLMLRYLLF